VHLLPTATSSDKSVGSAAVAILPIGSFEQHGEHLPLATDTVIACLIAQRLADSFDLLLLPPVTMSCSHEHAAFPGTVSVSATTLTAVIDDIRASLQRSGVDKIVLVNAHGGNYVVANLAQEANVDGRHVLLFPGSSDWAAARELAGMETNSREDMHAGELETSILLHALPDVVRPSYRQADHAATDRPHLHLAGMTEYTETGVIGKPSAATAEKGRAVLDSLVMSFDDHLKALLS
jgi:creatinine amidohydrolase